MQPLAQTVANSKVEHLWSSCERRLCHLRLIYFVCRKRSRRVACFRTLKCVNFVVQLLGVSRGNKTSIQSIIQQKGN